MTLQIDSDDTVQLAQELAALTGESLDAAVQKAVRQRLEKEREIRARMASMDAWLQTVRPHFGPEPVTKEEYDALCEDD